MIPVIMSKLSVVFQRFQDGDEEHGVGAENARDPARQGQRNGRTAQEVCCRDGGSQEKLHRTSFLWNYCCGFENI